MNVKYIASICDTSFLRSLIGKIVNSPIGSRLALGIFWSMGGAVISRGLMLCATVLVARILGKTGYGELGMIQSTVGMFGVFAGFGLGLTTTKHVAEFRQSDPERAGRIIGISGLVAMGTGGLMSLCLLIFAPWLAEHTINAPHLSGILRIGALILFFNALNGAQTGVLSGYEAFKTIAQVNVFVGLISFPILVCGAYFGGLNGAVWALAINLCFNWLLNHIALRKEGHRYNVPFSFKHCGSEWPILWKFSLPAVLSGIMVSPVNWACRALLTNQPNGYDEIAILTAAFVIQVMLMFVSGMLNAPLLSMVSNAGLNISDKLTKVNFLSSWILGVIVAIPLLCFPEIVQMVFGDGYGTHSFKVTFSLIVFCSSIITFKSGLTRSMVSNNMVWFGFFSNTLWAVTQIVATLFFVSWGASGLAVASTIAYILQTVIVLPICYSRKFIPKGTLFSIDSFLIWFLLIGLVFMNIIDTQLLFRSIAFVPCVFFTGYAFIRMSRG